MRIYVHSETQQEPEAEDAAASVTIAEAIGLEKGEVALLEDEDDPLEATLTLEAAGLKERGHIFRGRRHRIEVDVIFNGEVRERRFPASARVRRVFRWATGEDGFDLSEHDAAEHELVITGTDEVPGIDVHLGSLDRATPGHVSFALVPKHRFEG